MLKFLSWLLVPLLPLSGLLSGVWLLPEKTARWQIKFKDVNVKGLGFVNEGRTLLLAESRNNNPKMVQFNGPIALIGLDVMTGEQLFRTAFPAELLKGGGPIDATLTDDGTKVLLNSVQSEDKAKGNSFQVVAYDWQRQLIAKRYFSAEGNGGINMPILRSSTLIAVGATPGEMFLLVWHGADEEPTAMTFGKNYFFAGLNEDGELAYVSLSPSGKHQLVLIDVKSKTVLQTIDGLYREVRWSSDHQSFQAFEVDLKNHVYHPRRFQLIDQKYVLDQRSEPNKGPTDSDREKKQFVAITTFTQSDPWRKELVSLLGSRLKIIVDRIWPEGQVVQLYDKKTNSLLHRLVYPMTARGSPFPHPDGQLMALCDLTTASMWDIYPTSRWYPLFGLSIGILLATLLAWRLIARHSATNKATVPVTPNAVG